MNIVLVHPVHGAKVATHEKELESDEKNGWTRYNQPVVDEVASVKPKVRKTKQTTIEQPNEVPDFLAPVSDESEGH